MASAAVDETDAPATIEVRPLTIHIGAEIGGVDLTKPLSPRTVKEIRAALLKWKVIFFHDQFIDHDQHLAFARQFGEPTIGHAVYGHIDGYPEIYSIAKKRAANRYGGPKMVTPWTGWHADITSAINPPAFSILRGETLPPYGGDTQWTNLAAAYEGLSEPMRGFVDTLRGLHYSAAPDLVPGTAAYEDYMRQRRMVSEHPIVRVHPETGDRALYISPSYLKEIVGMAPRESQAFCELLWEHAVRQEYTVRFRWKAGDIAFWDNRAACHHAPTDIFEVDIDRQLYRITLVGDVPVGVDGRPSTAVEGDPITAYAAE
jgi:taurine dioxygenase